MRKRICLFLILISLFLCLNLFSVFAITGDEIKDDLEKNIDQIENVKDKVDSIHEGPKDKSSIKWNYLAEEWPKIFLRNSVISAIDLFFNKINFVFVLFMGVNYSFSFSFLFIFILWIYLAFNIAYLLKAISIFGRGFSWILSILIIALIGQTGFFINSVKWAELLFNTIVNFIDILIIALFLFLIFLWILFYFFENTFIMIGTFYKNKVNRLKEQIESDDKALFHMLTSEFYKMITGKEKKYKKHSSSESFKHYISQNSS